MLEKKMKITKQGIRKKKGDYKRKEDRQTKKSFLNNFTKKQTRKKRGVKQTMSNVIVKLYK